MLIIFYIYIVTKAFEIFKINAKQWLIGIVVFLALIGTQFILQNHFRVLYPVENDIVIKGNGEIVEHAKNTHLITTDKDLFIYVGDGIPFRDIMSYSFDTKDGQTHDVKILITFPQTDFETIRKSYQVFSEVVESYDNSLVYYFSSFSYFTEVVEEKFRDEFSRQIGNVKKDEISKVMMVDLINNFESKILNEHEKKMFSIELN
ncbi:hypothetical protein [Aquibacillus rhizosphaerae]|uniref:Uncharacterized protein n=1 Tax=Aquibacillus rhizosphaerae TaxID=3051431 RepID=A0ABT7L9A3_9BACI|nr:hypothetical protein [Aquibacillus sp. LR5S19]MDL4842439.1 hypothetical protein [Aquibacillus sp. LR5S19]